MIRISFIAAKYNPGGLHSFLSRIHPSVRPSRPLIAFEQSKQFGTEGYQRVIRGISEGYQRVMNVLSEGYQRDIRG